MLEKRRPDAGLALMDKLRGFDALEDDAMFGCPDHFGRLRTRLADADSG